MLSKKEDIIKVRMNRIKNLQCIDWSRKTEKIPIFGRESSYEYSYLKYSIMPCDKLVYNLSPNSTFACNLDPVQIKLYFSQNPVYYMWIDQHLADNNKEGELYKA